jgi:glycosyltransferase involved in cell wall biosynthesis
MRRLIDRHATDIVGCCEGVMDEAWSTHWRSDPRCRAVYYGIDGAAFAARHDQILTRAELKVPAGERMFLHLGRVSADRQKNHLRLLEIFAEIRKAEPASWLVLAGSGTSDADGEIARRIHELRIQDRVITLGVRHDVPRLLAAADVFLLPSLFEGLPNVVLEACAAGVPMLTSDLPGVREIASRLSLVRYLPLSASDAEWAAAASGLPAEAERLRLRDTAAGAFRASVFHIDRAVEAHRALWRSAAATEERTLACS